MDVEYSFQVFSHQFHHFPHISIIFFKQLMWKNYYFKTLLEIKPASSVYFPN